MSEKKVEIQGVAHLVPVAVGFSVDGQNTTEIVFLDFANEKTLCQPGVPDEVKAYLEKFIQQKKTAPMPVPSISPEDVASAVEKGDGSILKKVMPDVRR